MSEEDQEGEPGQPKVEEKSREGRSEVAPPACRSTVKLTQVLGNRKEEGGDGSPDVLTKRSDHVEYQ